MQMATMHIVYGDDGYTRRRVYLHGRVTCAQRLVAAAD